MQSSILNGRARAKRAESIGGEHADDVRIRLQDRRRLCLGGVGAVLIIVDARDHQSAIFSSRQTTLFALIGRANARARVCDVDLCAFAQRVGQRRTSNVAALGVVRADVGDREGDLAVGIIAIADEGIDGEHDDAAIMRGLQNWDRLFLVVGRGHQGINAAAGDQSLNDGRRDGDVEALGVLLDDAQAQVFRGLIDARAHSDVEGIRIYARHKGDGIAIVLRHDARYQRHRKHRYRCQYK